MFAKNVGTWDRVLRLVVGGILIWLAFINIISAIGYLGVLFVLASAAGYCPAYKLFGIKTCKLETPAATK